MLFIFIRIKCNKTSILGFSFTEHNDGYATNFSTVGEQLFEALMQFYTMFPEQRPNPFYIIAESYGGIYTIKLTL